MSRKSLLALAALGSAAAALAYRYRRPLIARALGLPPARYGVRVTRDLRVPMPDGVSLAADHYAPLGSGPFPTILMRTPYGRLAMDPLVQRFAERGYQVLVQDVRGRFGSEGEWRPLRHEAEDGRATLEWVGRQPWFDGRLGMWGASYLGYVQWAVAAGAPDFLKALMPTVSGSQFVTLSYPDGAFGLDTMLRWTYQVSAPTLLEMLWRVIPVVKDRVLNQSFDQLPLAEIDRLTSGAPVAYYREWLEHPRRDDPYWQAVDHSADVPRVTVPVHIVAGWHDILLRESIADYCALEAAGRAPYLTAGPWTHLRADHLQHALRLGLAWFDAHLKGERAGLPARRVNVYVMGADEWRALDAWPPPARDTRYYLRAAGALASEAPGAGEAPDGYRYDPADPTPAVGGAMMNWHAGARDNRLLEARPDVLCYTTPPLEHDLEIIGCARAELYVRSSLAHTDFFARLCDVYPDGRSINVCDGFVRLDGVDSTAGMRQMIELAPSAYRFLRGHRLRLQVSSGAHPHWARNLGTGEPFGTGTRMRVAQQSVYHDREHASALWLPVTGAGPAGGAG